MIKKLLFFWMVFCAGVLQAQDTIPQTDTIKKKRVSNEYVELYDDDVKLRLGFSNSFNSFHINDPADNLDFTLSPNQRIKTTFTFAYKFIEFDIGYTPEFIRFNKDDDDKGKSTFYSLAARFYFGHWLQSVQYSKTKGFYVDRDDIGSTENVLFPNLQVERYSGSTAYIFNPNFSFRSIFKQSEWQKKSVGSFVPSINYNYTQIKNGEPQIDHIIDVAVGPAYYYNWVINEKFLVAPGVYGGVGYNYTKTVYDDNTPDEVIDGLSFQTQLRLTLIYNSPKFYTGATASLNTFYYDADPQIHLQDRQQFFEFFIGYRFKGPEKVGKFLDNPPKPQKKSPK